MPGIANGVLTSSRYRYWESVSGPVWSQQATSSAAKSWTIIAAANFARTAVKKADGGARIPA